ncbi:DUF6343 family protein [Pseudokineococcus sp. 1T1Z-3]|uniref:DUF6343 family protein n=1 Tax=Pseudokineococcus sp. 1T1Z-3 TaxID=3132745 RepID=UPI0030AD842E
MSEPPTDESRHGVGGAPPARSALTLRAVLAVFGLLVCALGAGWVLAADGPTWIVVLLAVLGVVAAVDLVVIGRRLARGERG